MTEMLSSPPDILECDRGDHEVFHMAITKRDEDGIDQVVPLTGCKVWWWIAESPKINAPAIVLKDTDTGGIVVTDSANGKADVYLNPEDTEDLSPSLLNKSLPWEIQIKDAADKIQTVARGKIKIKSDIIIPDV